MVAATIAGLGRETPGQSDGRRAGPPDAGRQWHMPGQSEGRRAAAPDAGPGYRPPGVGDRLPTTEAFLLAVFMARFACILC